MGEETKLNIAVGGIQKFLDLCCLFGNHQLLGAEKEFHLSKCTMDHVYILNVSVCLYLTISHISNFPIGPSSYL